MPETVLAGPNGDPAIDEATGQPLTIEELLRRRGFMEYGRDNSTQAGVSPVSSAPVSAVASPASASTAVPPSSGVVPTVAASTAPVDPNAIPITPQELNKDGSSLIGPAIGGAADIASVLAYNKMKNRKKPVPVGNDPTTYRQMQHAPSPGKAGGEGNARLPRMPLEGEFTDVPDDKLISVIAKRLIGRIVP